MATSCTTIVQYHDQDINVDIIKVQNIFITARILPVALFKLYHFYDPLETLATTNLFSITLGSLFKNVY